MRLLIAEDDLDLAEALTVFFEKNHFSVDAVHNGFDAYEYASSSGYDGVILDVMMPKMNGIQVLERLRAEGCKTPIMMLTAKGQKDDRITGFNAGADDYLPKPFDPDELLSRVRAMLRRSEAYQPSVLSCGDVALDPSTGLHAAGTPAGGAAEPPGHRPRGAQRPAAEAVHHRRQPRAEKPHHRHRHQPEGAGDGGGHQKWIDKAQAQTEKLTELVNSLVTLSRMDEENSPLKMEPFPISGAVTETAESFRELAQTAGHPLVLAIQPELVYSGDEYAVRQLVSILLDNAVKYAAPESPITLSLEKSRRGVVLRCGNCCAEPDSIDTGKLFDRFYQAGPSRGAGGFGVGLSIARGIAEGHHGAIRAVLSGDAIEFIAELKG